eukprot:101117-Pyramimonas_sp.AAC.1
MGKARYDESCPYFRKRFKCDSTHSLALQFETPQGGTCTAENLVVSDWPTDRTVWLIGDSIYQQLLVSLACQLRSKIYQRVPLSPQLEEGKGRQCLLLRGGGRLCHYFLGCFSGRCFMSGCPTDGNYTNCLQEVLPLIGSKDIVITGLGVHIREDEAHVVSDELVIFEDMYTKLRRKGAIVFWADSSAQHFQTPSGRLTVALAGKGGRQHISRCRALQQTANVGAINSLAIALVLKLGVLTVPMFAISKFGSNLHYPNRHDCTHFCNPGVPDLFSDYVFAAIRSQTKT